MDQPLHWKVDLKKFSLTQSDSIVRRNRSGWNSFLLIINLTCWKPDYQQNELEDVETDFLNVFLKTITEIRADLVLKLD